MKTIIMTLHIILCTFYSIKVQARDTTSQTAKQDSVIGVTAMKSEDTDSRRSYLNQRIKVRTKGLDSLIKVNEHIVLFINGVPINSCEAKPSIKNRQDLIFNIGDSTAFHEIWDLFYMPNKNVRQVTISAGIKNGDPLPAIDNNFTIVFYDNGWLYGAYIAIIILFIAFLVLASSSNIIKEPNNSLTPPYSLARTQLALWTFVIISSYIYIWIVKDNFNSINGTALILLGISAVTALSGTLISNTQVRQDLTHTLQSKSSKGFMLDILSDESGVSIHRFQNLLFNLILGLIFLIRVYENLEMPSFSETILTLMGISSGTYAALKATENRNLTHTVAPAAPVAPVAPAAPAAPVAPALIK
jgi:hypothetical protein